MVEQHMTISWSDTTKFRYFGRTTAFGNSVHELFFVGGFRGQKLHVYLVMLHVCHFDFSIFS